MYVYVGRRLNLTAGWCDAMGWDGGGSRYGGSVALFRARGKDNTAAMLHWLCCIVRCPP